MLRIHRAVVLIVCCVVATSVGAQEPIRWETTFDDHGPDDADPGFDALVEPDGAPSDWGVAGPPLLIEHQSALAVKVADFDGDGILDLVVGSIGDVLPRVYYVGRGHTWFIKHVETLGPSHFSRATYDVDVGDVDGDGWTDILLGRRLPCEVVDEDGICVGTTTRTDTVFFNRGSSVGPGAFDRFDNPNGAPAPSTSGDNPPLALPIPSPAGTEPIGWRETIGTKLRRFASSTGPVGVLSTGRYGIRYFEWDTEDETFELVQTISETAQPSRQPIYRQIAVGDIDGDGDLDAVVPRGHLAATSIDGSPEVYEFDAGAFLATPVQSLSSPTPYSTQLIDVVGGGSMSIASISESFEAALGDLDGDGDLDLVIANSLAPNVAYLNDGTGRFGSDGITADGLPAHEFVSVTPEFFGPPADTASLALPQEEGGEWFIQMPGGYLDHTTGVTLYDDDGDDVVDLIAFSNRNEADEAFTLHAEDASGVCFGTYLTGDPVGHPVPAVYDHLYRNITPDGGALTISPYVELLGEPNDGTAYGEFFDLNPDEDHSPEWIDANFRNDEQYSRNFLYWGHALTARADRGSEYLPHIDDLATNATTVSYPLHVALSETQFDTWETMQVDYEVYVSSTGSYPPGDWIGVDVPLQPSPGMSTDVFDTLCKMPGSGATGFFGSSTLAAPPTPGMPVDLDIDLEIPRSIFDAVFADVAEGRLWFAVVLRLPDGDPRWVSNALEAPNAALGTPTSPPNPHASPKDPCED